MKEVGNTGSFTGKALTLGLKVITNKTLFVTGDEDTGVFLRRSWATGLLTVPPAHLLGKTAKAVTRQTPHLAPTASAKQAQHARSGHTEPHT